MRGINGPEYGQLRSWTAKPLGKLHVEASDGQELLSRTAAFSFQPHLCYSMAAFSAP